jgi:hypothetical protein
MIDLNPLLADPFEAQHRVYQDKARWQLVCAGLGVLSAVLAVCVVLLALRPPTVIIKDRLQGQAPELRVGEVTPAITQADARIFFLNMLKLRFGWDSLTVSRDMEVFLGQCYRDQRQVEMGHLRELVATSEAADASKKPRLAAWAGASIANTLLLPEQLEDIKCEKKDGIWHCSLQGSIVTQSLSPPFKQPAPKQDLAFVATLLEVRHTTGTPYGLIVGAMRQFSLPTALRKEASE